MNAIQNKKQSKRETQLNLALIPLEKAQTPSLWQRMKMTFATSDLDFSEWQRLESKRIKQGSSEQWRNH